MSDMKYRHPYDELIIQDNTGFIETLAVANTGTTLLSAFLSSKGENNVLKTFTNSSSFIKEYGKPKFKEHGQSIYNIINWLNGGGNVQCIRVAAADATYANVMVIVKVKKTEDAPVLNEEGEPLYVTPTGEETTSSEGNEPLVHDKAVIKIQTKSVSNLTDKSALLTALTSEYSSMVDADGFMSYPLFAVCDKGAGKIGNSTFFRINRNTINDTDTTYPNYNVESIENIDGIAVVDKPMNVALYPDATNIYGENQFIGDLVANRFSKVNLYFDEEHYTELCTELQSCIDNVLSIHAIDPLFAIDNINGTAYKFITIDNDSIILNSATGIVLTSGTDGAFDVTSPTRDNAISAQLIKAYTGELDPAIYNSKRFPADIALDANFDYDTKMAIMTCKTRRGSDLQVILDAGILVSIASAEAWRVNPSPASSISFSDYEAKLYPQHVVVVDPYTNKDIKVTLTYLLAQAIPRHDSTYGNHIPLAEKYCVMYGHKKGTLLPVPITEDEKESLYTKQMNYCEEEVDGSIVINTELTAQKKNSDLSKGNNVRVLLEMKKLLRGLIPTWRYDFMSEADLERFNREANALIKEKFLDTGKCAVANVVVSADADQRRMSILQVDLGVSFYPIVERTLQYIRVNPY